MSGSKSNPDPILPVVLTVTVYPPKKGVRKVVVSGAPEGEMPLMLTGLFQDRHTLLDQAYAQCLKRDPQLVTIVETKPTVSKAKSITAGADDDETDEAETTDQLVEDLTPSPSPLGEGDEDLPAIECDAVAILSDISSPTERGEVSTLEAQILDWKEEDHGQQD
jgi:hypothetical protein